MATYAWSAASAGAIPMGKGDKHVLFNACVNIPNLVTYGGLDAALPSTGFADGDVLEVFNVPAGTLILQVGIFVVTGEGATATIDIGVVTAAQIQGSADTDGFLDGGNIETADVAAITAVAAGHGVDNLMGIVYVTDGTIDIEFNNDDTETAVFDVWAVGCKVNTSSWA